MQRTAAYLCPPEFSGPKGIALLREATLVWEAARLVSRATPFSGASAPIDADPVLLVPGFMVGDCTLRPLAGQLRRRGFYTYRARILANAGCLTETADRLERRIEEIAERRGRPVTLIGHSLGGLLARGLAARRPDVVGGLVTLGSPLLAPGAVHGLLLANVQLLVALRRAGLGRVLGADCADGECARDMWALAKRPLSPGTDFVSVYSKRDGVVDWRACLDPAAEPVEVRGSHLGMTFDPATVDAIADRLGGQCSKSTAA